MAKAFCLIKESADKFLAKLRSGEINPENMNSMSSEERRKFFEDFMDAESAKQTNILFEKTLLLKNSERGMIRWAEKLSGVTMKQREEIIKKIKANKEERLRRTFSPEEDEAFLNDIVDQRLGIGVSEEEAKTIFELSKKVQNGSELFDKNKIHDRLSEISGGLTGKQKETIDNFIEKLDSLATGKKISTESINKIKKYLSGENPSDEVKKNIGKLIDDIVKSRKDNIKYGSARVALDDYVGEIKLGIKEPWDLSMESAKRAVSEVAGFAKSVLASIDNSFIGRQGIKTLYTGHPIIWGKTLVKSLEILAKSIGGKEMLKGVRAEIYGRKNSMNGTYDLMKLAVGQAEEAYPTSLPEKIPFLGRLFKASQEAFTGSAYYMRAELADQLIEKRLAQGVDLEDKVQAESLGNLINSMTGRGTAGLGKLGKTTNTIFFSPKFFQSNLDTLTAHVFDKNVTVRDKKEAAMNLLKIVSSIGGILWLADTLKPGSVEWDPRSSDFGKIRIGDTRFDISGGIAGIVTLVSRIFGTKSSTTGVITKPGDYNGRTPLDLLGSFAENKLSPFAGTILDVLKGEDFNGDPYTIQALKEDPKDVSWRLIKGLIVPIPLGSAQKNFGKYNTGTALAITIIDGLGFGTNTYGFTNNWNKNTGVELQQFKDKVGKEEFDKANDVYATAVNDKILKLRKDERFNAMNDDEKTKVLNKVKDVEKEKIFKQYKFTYKKEKRDIQKNKETEILQKEYSK